MEQTPGGDFLRQAAGEFRAYKHLADRALAQVGDEDFLRTPNGEPTAESNSLAIVVQHMAGNLLSRWTDFLTTDGEKPDRNRDAEFEVGERTTRTALAERWEAGWGRLFATLEGLSAADLGRTVTVRGESLPVPQAILRQLGHQAYHAGQIVFLAKLLLGAEWRNLSMPKRASGSPVSHP